MQPYSGSPANLAVYLAFLKPGDKVMGLALPMGGHLTHGWNVSITGSTSRRCSTASARTPAASTTTRSATSRKKERPALLWAGGTAYSRLWDFETMASIAREVGARFCADIAHIAGLIAGGAHPSPVPARRRGHDHDAQDAARAARRHDPLPQPSTPRRSTGPCSRACRAARTSTTPRRSPWRCARRPQPSFKDYAKQIVSNARALAEALIARGFDVVSGGTDNHLILIDLTNKNVSGKVAAKALDKAGHRAELQLGPLRHAQAVRPLGHPPGLAGGHQPRAWARPR